MADPNIRRAKQALERLSADPFTQHLMREQEVWAWNYENTLRQTRREGVEEGEARGEAKGRANALLAVLAARGVSVSDDHAAIIRACRDLEQLDTWLRRAVSASSCEALLLPEKT